MLKRNRRRVERVRIRRSDNLVEQAAVRSVQFNPYLKSARVGLAKDCGVEVERISGAVDRSESLREGISLRIAPRTQRRRVTPVGRSFGRISHVADNDPAIHAPFDTEWRGFEVSIR
jgi:hypothetical protein